MDTDHCPKCDAATVVAGRMPPPYGHIDHSFQPTGMPLFRWSGSAPSCSKEFRACLSCGLVWTHLRPEELRTFIDKHGTAKLKLKLSPFRKAPPEQDLA